MEISKDIVYFGGVLITMVGSYYAVKFQTKQNTIDISKLKDEIMDKLDNNDKLHYQKLQEHENKLQAGFKKIDKFEDRISILETKATHFLTFDKSKELHPTKEGFELVFKDLKETDRKLSEELKEFKKDIDKKLSKVAEKLDEHIEEGRMHNSQVIELLKGK